MFSGKGVLKICSKLIDITLWHGCSPVNLLNIFRTPFSKNTSGWLFLMIFHFLGVNKLNMLSITVENMLLFTELSNDNAELKRDIASCSALV